VTSPDPETWIDAIVTLERVAANAGCPVPRVVDFDGYLYAMDEVHHGYSILVWAGSVWQPHMRRIA
jgi:hypothetical protein